MYIAVCVDAGCLNAIPLQMYIFVNLILVESATAESHTASKNSYISLE